MKLEHIFAQPAGTSFESTGAMQILAAEGVKSSRHVPPRSYQSFRVSDDGTRDYKLVIWGVSAEAPSVGDWITLERCGGKLCLNEYPENSGNLSLRSEDGLLSFVEGMKEDFASDPPANEFPPPDMDDFAHVSWRPRPEPLHGATVGLAMNQALVDARESHEQFNMKWVARRASEIAKVLHALETLSYE